MTQTINPQPNSTTPPTSYWNLDTAQYNGSFTGVSNVTGIYTNYYFSPNSSNTLYMSNTVTGENFSSQQYYIRLYDYNTGSLVYQNEETVSGTTKWTFTYSGLNTNHFYYIQWIAAGSNQKIDGTFSVYH